MKRIIIKLKVKILLQQLLQQNDNVRVQEKYTRPLFVEFRAHIFQMP